MEFETILDLEGVKFKVHGLYAPPEQAISWRGILEEPEILDDIDLLDIKLGDEGLTQNQEDSLLQGYGYSDFCEWLLDEGRKAFKENKEDNKIMQRLE